MAQKQIQKLRTFKSFDKVIHTSRVKVLFNKMIGLSNFAFTGEVV